MEQLSICAVIAVRNEYNYLRVLLPYLKEQNIDVVILDNDSDDESNVLYNEFEGSPIIQVTQVPYNGFFDNKGILVAKESVIQRLNHEWVIHHDADEILEHHASNKSLREAIEEADTNGYNVVNFEEFVFLPEENVSYEGKDYYNKMSKYYFFAPKNNRLNRAWKREANLNHLESGGHKLEGESVRIYPKNHILRHYITLSYEHAINKYCGRKFSQDELEIGWHHNRTNISARDLIFPSNNEKIHRLEEPQSKAFNRNTPSNTHYWQWRLSERKSIKGLILGILKKLKKKIVSHQ